MKYDKISFTLEDNSTENQEILTAFIAELPFESFSETDKGLDAFAPEGLIIKAQLQSIISLLPFPISYTIEKMPDVNWNEEWEKNYFEPLFIGEDCLIRAPFHTNAPKSKYEIIINPNMAFGTGNHETTSLMVEHINDLDLCGKDVLDMGCGTGILGIYASMKNCNSITAIDIDKWAYESTEENCKLNDIENIDCHIGDASLLSGDTKYDVIFANIHKNIIINDLAKYYSSLQPNGIIILSGFYKADLDDVTAVAKQLSLSLKDIKEKNNWVAVSYTA